MQDSETIRNLLTRDELNALQTRRPRIQFLYYGFFCMLWAGGISLNLIAAHSLQSDSLPGTLLQGIWSWALLAAGTLAIVLALNAFFLIMHEGTHHLIASRPRLNRWIAFATGIPIFLSFTAYQVMHLRHHEYLGDPRDPDDYGNYTHNPLKLWALHYLRLLAAAFLYLPLIPFLSWKQADAHQRIRLLQEYGLLLAIYIPLFVFVPLHALWFAWFLPILFLNFFINLRGLTQHSVAEAQDPWLASRSVESSPLVGFLYLNENYHLEHHLFPSVPCYNLARLNRILRKRWPRALTAPSYLWFLGRFLKASLRGDRSPIGIIRGSEQP